jgi:hypothetical protein
VRVVGHPEFSRGAGGWLTLSALTTGCGSSVRLALPDDPGLDGAAVLDDCGALVGLVAPQGGRGDCEQPEGAAALASPLQPTACLGGARELVGALTIGQELAAQGVPITRSAGCDEAGTPGLVTDTPLQPAPTTPATTLLLQRARSSVFWLQGVAVVALSDPSVVVIPKSVLPLLRPDDRELIGVDGTEYDFGEGFRFLQPLTESLWGVVIEPGSVGIDVADDAVPVAGQRYYLLGHADGLSCRGGWTASEVTYRGALGADLVFEGPVFAVGGAILDSEGRLVAIADRCERPDAALAPGSMEGGALPLDGACAIIGVAPPPPG